MKKPKFRPQAAPAAATPVEASMSGMQRLVTALTMLALVVGTGFMGYYIAETRQSETTTSRTFGEGHAWVDNQGALKHIVVGVDPSYPFDLRPTFSDLFSSLSPDVKVTVAYRGDRHRKEVEAYLQDIAGVQGRAIEFVDASGYMGTWVRDAFVTRQSPSGAEVLMPSVEQSDRQREVFQREAIEKFSRTLVGDQVLSTPFNMEGGELVFGARHVFCTHQFLINGIESGEFDSISDVREAAAHLFKRPVLPLQRRRVDIPMPHADLVVAPLSDTVVALSDPEETLRLLTNMRANGEYDALAERINSLPLFREHHADHLGLMAADLALPEQQAKFRVMRETLEGEGYTVLSLPLLYQRQRDNRYTAIFSWSNVVFDETAGRRVVLMPVYGFPTLDVAAEKVFAGAGYEVKRIRSANLALMGGAIRCATNVIERSPSDPSTMSAAKDAALVRR